MVCCLRNCELAGELETLKKLHEECYEGELVLYLL